MEGFLESLRRSLNGKIPESEVTEALNYYREYIDSELTHGRSMEDLLNELGDPSLIAKTIVTTSKVKQGTFDPNEEAGVYTQTFVEDDENSAHTRSDRKDKRVFNNNPLKRINSYKLKAIMVKVLQILKILLVITVVVLIAVGLFRIAFKIAIPVLVIYLIYRIIRMAGENHGL